MVTNSAANGGNKSYATDAAASAVDGSSNFVSNASPGLAAADATLGSDRTSMYVRRQLTFIDDEEQEIFPELVTPTLIPVDRRGGDNQFFVHAVREHWGEAAILDCCDRAPIVGMSMCEVSSRAVDLGAAAKWCYKDADYARQAGKPLERELLMTADRAIYELLERMIWEGDSKLGVMGIVNNKTIPSVNLGDMTTLHPVEMMKRILIAIAQVIAKNRGVGRAPDTLLLPPSIYALWSSSMMGMNFDRTLLDVIRINSPFIQRIEWIHALETAGPGGTPIGFAFVNDPAYIKIRIPNDIRSLPIHWDGANYCQTRRLTFAGVRVDNPSSALLIEGLKGINTCLDVACSGYPVFNACPDN